MYEVKYCHNGDLINLSIWDKSKLINQFSIRWVDNAQQIVVYQECLFYLAQIFNVSPEEEFELTKFAYNLDQSVDKIFSRFSSRPKHKDSEYDHYFNSQLENGLQAIIDDINTCFQEKTETALLIKKIFLCISDSVKSIANVYLDDNRVQNKIRMQKVRNNDKSLSDFSMIKSDTGEEDAILQTLNVANMLNRLSPEQKRRIIKYYFEGYTLREIASEEGVDFTAVYQSLKRAIKKMSEM